jgi:hypothetical protein
VKCHDGDDVIEVNSRQYPLQSWRSNSRRSLGASSSGRPRAMRDARPDVTRVMSPLRPGARGQGMKSSTPDDECDEKQLTRPRSSNLRNDYSSPSTPKRASRVALDVESLSWARCVGSVAKGLHYGPPFCFLPPPCTAKVEALGPLLLDQLAFRTPPRQG